jgi:dephospho-CoA kinase
MSKPWPDKFIIGLTGNIATGKSTVMRFAAEQGALTLDADKIVHQIMDSDPAIRRAIANKFGANIQRPDGRVNRAALGAIVFRDADALRNLEGIMHPAVRANIEATIEASETAVIMVEAIKLLEGPLADICDQIWVTDCQRVHQIDRLMVCRGLDWETAVMRVSAQPSQEAKVARADVVIETDGTIADSRSQFEMAWERLPVKASLPPLPAEAEAPPPPAVPAPPETPAAAKIIEEAKETAQEAGEDKRGVPQRLDASKAAELRKRLRPSQTAVAEPTQPEAAAKPAAAPGDVTVRRARPSDIPSILLLIQRATEGRVKMKRAELLLALGERSYFLGQTGSEIKAVVGWSMENLVARMDQIYFHPLEEVTVVGPPILDDIQDAANNLICESLMAFLPHDTPGVIRQLFSDNGYNLADKEQLPRTWKMAAEESQPDGTYIMLKILRDSRVTQPM